MKANKNKKVLVALSGGVDSSVAAALLKRAGFDLIGVFMKFWQSPRERGFWNRCCSLEASQRARAVADLLGIPFYVLNLENCFKKTIVDYFLKEYKAGRTPNPCVLCNKEIKFNVLLKKALELKADFVATGHYALKRELKMKNEKLKVARLPLSIAKSACQPAKLRLAMLAGQQAVKSFKLLRAKDKNKDQTYFLWKLKQKELGKLIFPLGNYTKQEVRRIAKQLGLPTAQTPESQEVCFIDTTTADFLKQNLKEKRGDILDLATGKKIGEHQGLWLYTIGQRKGLPLRQGPWFVVKKNSAKNFLFVSKNAKELLQKEIRFNQSSWLSGEMPQFPAKAMAKIRSSALLGSCLVYRGRAVFIKPQKAVAKGQSIVFYSKAKPVELLGGGVIT